MAFLADICFHAWMKITNEDMWSFKEIYRKEFNEDISDAEARGMAHDLVLVYVLFGTPTEQEDELFEREKLCPDYHPI